MNRNREKFRNEVFSRDRHICVMCGSPGVDAHHIIDRNEIPNGGYVKENGITLCHKCHMKAELYHQTEGMDWHVGFHPNSLFWMIHSSPQSAIEKSRRLQCS